MMVSPRKAAGAALLMAWIWVAPTGRASAQGLSFSVFYRALRPLSGPYGLELLMPAPVELRWPSALSMFSPRHSQEKAPLTRFAHLAGMFMGRVDAAQWGGLRINIKLALK